MEKANKVKPFWLRPWQTAETCDGFAAKYVELLQLLCVLFVLVRSLFSSRRKVRVVGEASACGLSERLDDIQPPEVCQALKRLFQLPLHTAGEARSQAMCYVLHHSE